MKSNPLVLPVLFLFYLVCASCHSYASPSNSSSALGPAYVKKLYASNAPIDIGIKKSVKNAYADREKAIAAANAAGIRLEYVEASIPKSDDAAPYYSKFFGLIQSEHFGFPFLAEPLSMGKYKYNPDDLKQVRKLIADHPDIFKAMHQAVSKKDCSWRMGADFPVYASLRAASRDLMTEGFSLALEKRYDDALMAEKDALHVVRHVQEENSLISALVAMACQSITIRGYQDLLSAGGERPGYAKKIAKIVRENAVDFSVNEPIKKYEAAYIMACMESERRNSATKDFVSSFPMSIAKIGDPMFPKGNDLLTLTPDELALWNNLFYEAEAQYLSEAVQILNVEKVKSFPDRETRYVQLLASYAPNKYIMEINGGDFLNFDNNFAQSSKRMADSEADVQVTLAACEAFDAKSRTGSFPRSLAGRYIDPWSGKQVGYEKTKGGFIVYSVGEDGSFRGDPDRIDKNKYPRPTYYRHPIKQIPMPEKIRREYGG